MFGVGPVASGVFARILAGGACAVLLLPAPSLAQDAADTAPASIHVVDGDVTIDREGELSTAEVGMPLVAGDRLTTDRGRAELLLVDGSALDVDEYTTIELARPQLIRLLEGRVRLTVPRDSREEYQLDTPSAMIRTEEPGEFRVAVMGGPSYPQTELAVFQGRVEFVADQGSVVLNAGQRSTAWINDVPSRPEPFNSARLDSFDRWTADLDPGRAPGRSAAYLPSDLRAYGSDFDQFGSWQVDASYGYVWYPRVDATWQPYYTGYWTSLPGYGWTWVGLERWAWPTHHYGRWGVRNSRWFWIPGRRWGPAWVSWASAPGYVSWCPLGFDDRPLFDLTLRYVGGRNGWTVLPLDRFGVNRAYVNRHAVAQSTFLPRERFVMESHPPVRPRSQAMRRLGNNERDRRGNGSNRETTRGRIASENVRRPRAGAPSASQDGRGTADRPETPRAVDRGAIRRAPPGRTEPSQPNRFGPYGPTSGQATPSQPGLTTAPAGRTYPFGDFRRGMSTADPDSPQQAPSGDATARPRRESAPSGRTPDSTADRGAPSRDRGTTRAPAGTSQAEPSSSAGTASPRAEPYRFGGAQRAERPGGGGFRAGAPAGGAPQSRGSSSSAGSSDGQAAGRSDGRTHAPESRRPPR